MPNAPYALELYAKWFKKDISPVLRAQAIGKYLMPVDPEFTGLGMGVLNIEQLRYNKRSKASVAYKIRKDNFDYVSVMGQNIIIPVIQDNAVIDRQHFESLCLKGAPIQSSINRDMARNLAASQTSLIVMGQEGDGVNVDTAGLYNVAPSATEVTAKGTITAAFNNCHSSVTQAIANMKAQGVFSTDGYNLTLPVIDYGELTGSVSPQGILEYDLVMKALNHGVQNGGQPGQIYESIDLPAGTALVTPTATQNNLQFFGLAETLVPTPYLWYEEANYDTGDVLIQLVNKLVPMFMHLDPTTQTDPCVCMITGLGTT